MSAPVRLTERASRLAHKGRPWFFADDLAVPAEQLEPGLVAVADHAGRPLGLALCSPTARLALRLTGDRAPDGPPPSLATFLDQRIAAALSRRADRLGPERAARIVHGEGDGIPGLVVDRYDRAVVVQVTSAPLEAALDELVASLDRHLEPQMILARHDLAVRRFEGLPEEIRLLSGRRIDEVVIDEGGVRHLVRPFEGHKTGFYLDQAPARAFVKRHARGRNVLDVFAYQGAFSLAALAGGAARALAIDESAPALERATAGASRNGLTGLEARTANAFAELRALRSPAERFGLIVVDPPAFAKSRREVDGALRGYRDLNRSALRLLAPGGLLVTCSCSHHVTAERFEDVVRQAAAGLPFRAVLKARFGAGDDHPVWLALPESEYLKVLVVERVD